MRSGIVLLSLGAEQDVVHLSVMIRDVRPVEATTTWTAIEGILSLERRNLILIALCTKWHTLSEQISLTVQRFKPIRGVFDVLARRE